MLAEKLKDLRKKRGLTQEQLAEELHVSRQAVAKWESGAGMPSIDNIRQISLLFHVSADWLLDTSAEKELTLKNKFNILEICLFFLGVSLGVVAQNFSFGFVMALLLPGGAYCIETMVLKAKYRKDKDTLAEKELAASQLPKNFYGRTLDTGKNSKKQRIKWYFLESALSACLLTLFTIVGALFNRTTLWKIELFSSHSLNVIFSCALSFVFTLLLFFLLDYCRYEHMIKKYNRIGKP